MIVSSILRQKRKYYFEKVDKLEQEQKLSVNVYLEGVVGRLGGEGTEYLVYVHRG